MAKVKLTPTTRIYVAGHRGLAGSAIVRCLRARGCRNLILAAKSDLDLRNQQAVDRFFDAERPEYVFLAAAKVGGILANSRYPAQFLYDNLMIEANVIHAAWQHQTQKLVFLGSSCAYPKHAPQPIPEDAVLSGPLEPTNESYAVAKIAGLKMGEAYRAQYGFQAINLMPTNLYGPGDNFDLETSHVLPAMIRRFHEAHQFGDREVVLWGSGSPRREFLHVDDFASACCFAMEHYEDVPPLNVGTGTDISVREVAELVARIVGFTGEVRFDRACPDGTPRKLLNISRLTELGWRPSIGLEEGILATYQWLQENNRQATVDLPEGDPALE